MVVLLDQCLQLNNLEQLLEYYDELYLDYLHYLLMLVHLLIRDVDDGYPVNLHENAKNRQNAQDEVVGWAVACQNNWTLINITHYLFHYRIGLIRVVSPVI